MQRHSGKKNKIVWPIVILTLLAIAVFALPTVLYLCGGIPGGNDWIYDRMPGKYAVWRTSSQSIDISYDRSVVINPYISYIAYNDDYIFAQQVELPEKWKASDGVDGLGPCYYIIVVKSRQVLGPFSSEAEFNLICAELGADPVADWIRTTQLPDL